MRISEPSFTDCGIDAAGNWIDQTICVYTSHILQLEERPWPVSACARVVVVCAAATATNGSRPFWERFAALETGHGGMGVLAPPSLP